jgi:hypothetical protein
MAKAKSVWPPEDRPVTGHDVKEFLRRFRLDINLMEAVFAIPSRKSWYELTKDEACHEPVGIPKAILLRFFAAYPEFIPFYTVDSAEDLREKLNLSPAAFGLLTGRQEISVRQWSPEREPHKVVSRLLWLIRKSINLMNGVRVQQDGQAMLADLVRFSFLEWSLRGETPSQRRTEFAATNISLFREVLSIVPSGGMERATSGLNIPEDAFLMEVVPLAPAKRGRKPKEKPPVMDITPVEMDLDSQVTADDRHRATRSVRTTRVAQKSMGDMAKRFSI